MVFERLSDNVIAFLAPVNIGIVEVSENAFIAIDTGIDNSALNKIIKEIGKTPKILLITHHHSDHMGGARKYSGQIPIYAPVGELGLIRKPSLEPTIFYGANPPMSLKNKYLMAKACPNVVAFDSESLKDYGLKEIKTPGHSPDLHSILIEDIIFASDAFLPQEIIERHGLLFLHAPNKAIESMQKILDFNPTTIVPGHGSLIQEREIMKETLRMTISHIESVRATLLEIIGEGISLENALVKALKALIGETTLQSFPLWRYFLNRHVILNYISEMNTDGQLQLEVRGGSLWVEATS